MLSAADQIDHLAIALVNSGGALLEGSNTTVAEDDLSAYTEIGFQYPSGHRLYVTLTIDVTYGYPAWALYAYQFQDGDGRTVFRYDNWPHYRELETFPHHKHVGPDERIEAHTQPSLAAIIREVSQYV
ncbi:MAG: DUF6516 family protein [Chloroflexota bacterium]